jgi:hypothetical protein
MGKWDFIKVCEKCGSKKGHPTSCKHLTCKWILLKYETLKLFSVLRICIELLRQVIFSCAVWYLYFNWLCNIVSYNENKATEVTFGKYVYSTALEFSTLVSV